ncbi:MAG: hypothetical protein IT440_14410 [Phycisphaeraceae bacterium]|nr:hypothetical protein [Phycisphaeraceae bacterium]
MNTRLTCSFVVALTLFATSATFAAVPAVLIGPDLQPRRVQLQGLRDDAVSFFDESRQYQTLPRKQVLRLTLDATRDEPRDRASGMMLELTDGQRLTGELVSLPADANADADATLAWRHAQLGDLVLPMEQVAAWRREASPPNAEPAAPTSDRAALVNGDVLTGFLVSLSHEMARFQVDGQSQPLDLPLHRIATLTLANPAAVDKLAASRTMVWLRDGSRLATAGFTLAEDQCQLLRPTLGHHDKLTLPVSIVHRIDLADPAYRLVDLADLPRTCTGGGEVFGVPMPARSVGSTLLLHAPITLNLTLPAGAQRLTANARLDLDAALTPALRQAAGFDLIVQSDDRTPERFRLDAEHDAIPLNLLLPTGTSSITLRLDPGPNGPVLDRLRLTDALLLLMTP